MIFSDAVKKYVTGNSRITPNLVVSNAELGPPHLLGTDTQGRDIFSHIINGGTSLILTAVLAGLFSTIIAVILGATAALVGGVVDNLLTAAANFVLTIPSFPLLIVLASLIHLDNFVLLAAADRVAVVARADARHPLAGAQPARARLRRSGGRA